MSLKLKRGTKDKIESALSDAMAQLEVDESTSDDLKKKELALKRVVTKAVCVFLTSIFPWTKLTLFVDVHPLECHKEIWGETWSKGWMHDFTAWIGPFVFWLFFLLWVHKKSFASFCHLATFDHPGKDLLPLSTGIKRACRIGRSKMLIKLKQI